MIPFSDTLAPFDIKSSPIFFEFFHAAIQRGVLFLEYNFLSFFIIILVKNNIVLLWKTIAFAWIFAPFDINSSPVSFELFPFDAQWSGVSF